MARRTLDCLVPVFVGKAQSPPATGTGDDFCHVPPWVRKGIYPTNIPELVGNKGQMASRKRERPEEPMVQALLRSLTLAARLLSLMLQRAAAQADQNLGDQPGPAGLVAGAAAAAGVAV